VSRPLVIKFGGTSLATPRRVRLAARRVRHHLRRHSAVVVVVSAAGAATDRLLARVRQIAPAGDEVVPGRGREVDRLLATGEDRSAALLAAALWAAGVPALSLRGGEAGIQADGPFGAAVISQVNAGPLRQALEGGRVPVVSGFQGCRPDGETATLGRGGSDTTAVAIAATLGAACHIVTDVSAVHDRDPRLHPGAEPLPALSHGGLRELTERGARVVHPAAAWLAEIRQVPLRIYHFNAPPRAAAGTTVDPAAGTQAPRVTRPSPALAGGGT
jgi:aspartate kinase